MSVEINGTIYAGEEEPLPAAGRGAARCSAGRGEGGSPVRQSTAGTACLPQKAPPERIFGLFFSPGQSECPVPSVRGLGGLNSKGRDFREALRGWSTAPLLLLRSGFTPLLLRRLGSRSCHPRCPARLTPAGHPPQSSDSGFSPPKVSKPFGILAFRKPNTPAAGTETHPGGVPLQILVTT